MCVCGGGDGGSVLLNGSVLLTSAGHTKKKVEPNVK